MWNSISIKSYFLKIVRIKQTLDQFILGLILIFNNRKATQSDCIFKFITHLIAAATYQNSLLNFFVDLRM